MPITIVEHRPDSADAVELLAELRLETGIYQPEAIGLYERFGFQRRPPFGEYRVDPLSIYYEKHLA